MILSLFARLGEYTFGQFVIAAVAVGAILGQTLQMRLLVKETRKTHALIESMPAKLSEALESHQERVLELHEWHDVPDPEHPGAQRWWGLRVESLLGSVLQRLEGIYAKVEALYDARSRR